MICPSDLGLLTDKREAGERSVLRVFLVIGHDLVLDALHAKVQKFDLLGTIAKLVGECFCPLRRKVVLIVELMLEARPEVHRDGSELYLDLHVAFLVFKEDRYLDDEMQAPVTARLRILDVVLPGDQGDVVLRKKCIGYLVDVVREGADDAYAGDVVDVLLDRAQVQRDVLPSHLTEQAVDRLDSACDVLDRVTLEFDGEGFVEDVELRFDFHDRAAVIGEELVDRFGVLLDEIEERIGHDALSDEIALNSGKCIFKRIGKWRVFFLTH